MNAEPTENTIFSGPRDRKRLYWGTAIFAFWTAVGLMEGLQSYYVSRAWGHYIPFSLAVRLPLACYWFWALATPVIISLVRRFPLERPRVSRNLLIHGCAWVCVSALYCAYRVPLHSFIYPDSGNAGPVKLFTYYFGGDLISNLLMYAILAGTAYGLILLQKYREREVEAAQLHMRLTEAQLQALKMQIQPHFLFNTLNSISALMREDVEAADNMMTDLSDLLRQTLESSDVHETTVGGEVNSLGPYLSIQHARFQDRLTFDVSVQPEARDALLPTLVLHTLVENAVRHGIAPKAAPGIVSVEISRRVGDLRVAVCDDGAGLKAPLEQLLAKGVGLRNTLQRLQQMYGNRGSLELTNRAGGGTQALLTIPFHTASITEHTPEMALP